MGLAYTSPLTVHAYDIVTGRHLGRVPFTACGWSEAINEPGSLSVDCDYSRDMLGSNLRGLLRSWRVILAAQRGDAVVHAGPLVDWEWDAEGRKLSLSCGGGMTLLSKRLVLPRGLRDSWRDRSVLVDERHPASDLTLSATGSLGDMMRALVAETLAWGSLPIEVGAMDGGDVVSMSWQAWDLGTVADRIGEIAKLDGAPEIRFDPTIRTDGSLAYQLTLRNDADYVARRWTAIVPDSRVVFMGVDGSGGSMAGQVWATGGKDGDRTLMSRRTSDLLTGQGLPLLQKTDTTHTTETSMTGLQQAVLGTLAQSAFPAETFKLRVGDEHDLRVGEHVDVTVGDDHLGTQTLRLKITDVSGSADSDWISVQAQERGYA